METKNKETMSQADQFENIVCTEDVADWLCCSISQTLTGSDVLTDASQLLEDLVPEVIQILSEDMHKKGRWVFHLSYDDSGGAAYYAKYSFISTDGTSQNIPVIANSIKDDIHCCQFSSPCVAAVRASIMALLRHTTVLDMADLAEKGPDVILSFPDK